jgi:RNA 3'-terminal phosphate cyclase (ATP)
LEGGTHNPFAPSFTFIKKCFLPLFNKMGPTVSTILECPGFAPQGGGKVYAKIEPTAHLQPLLLADRGDILQQYAEVLIAHLPVHIAERELSVIHNNLAYPDNDLHTYIYNKAKGPGNIVSIIINSEQITECFSAFGQRGIPAEQVAMEVVKQVQHYIHSGAPVDPYLADQLLVPVALAGSGEFVTMKPSLHAITNMSVIEKFIRAPFKYTEISSDVWRISLQ